MDATSDVRAAASSATPTTTPAPRDHGPGTSRRKPAPPPRQAPDSAAPRLHDVLVIGGGLSGLGTAIALVRAGIRDFVVLEKGSSLGGTWRDNTYPGCACDVPTALYSFSYAPYAEWDHFFARQPQIRAYVEHVAREFDVLRYVRFGAEVKEARWDEAAQRWHVETTDGTTYGARAVISAAGPLHEPRMPDVPGLSDFAGPVFHSARWRHDLDLRDKRVAVIGTGASAIQFVPEIQPRVKQLHLFQRTAPWVLPKPDFAISSFQKALFRRVPLAQKAVRGGIYLLLELLQLAERRPAVMASLHDLGRKYLERQVPDPALRAKLEPTYTLGCKRLLFSNTYYKALGQPNAEVIPSAVRSFGERTIVAADGTTREVDVVILGTGFYVTDPPIAARLRGRDGTLLADVWRGSPEAYKGTTIAGYPNLFMLIGPNTGNGHSSALVVLEAQLNYVVSALQTMKREGLTSVDVRPEVQAAYNDEVQRGLAGTVWNAGGCASYYLDANGRNSTIYPWTTIDLRRRTARFDLGAYRAQRGAGEGVDAPPLREADATVGA